jgi:Domain of unknown function (DUF4365)
VAFAALLHPSKVSPTVAHAHNQTSGVVPTSVSRHGYALSLRFICRQRYRYKVECAVAAKEIGRVAGGIFLSAIPGRWARRSQEDQEDYGVDYEIELTTTDDKATGFIFKVQQKGVEQARRLADGTVAFSLECEKVTYYLRQLRIPIVLVVVEVNSNTSWWVPLHANREIERDLSDALAAGQKTMTAHIPAANELAKTHDALLAAVRRMMDALTLAGLKAMPTADAQAVIDSEPDLDELERGLRMTHSLLRSTRTQRHVEHGELDAAFELNKRAFEDDLEPPEARFAAGMELVRVGGGIVVARGGDARERDALLKLRLRVTHELVHVCRSLASDHQLRTYSLFVARVSRLRVFTGQDTGLFFSRLAQQANPDEFAQYITAGAQRTVTISVVHELHHAQRLLLKLIDRGWFALVCYAWANLTETLQEFMTRLKHDGLTDGATELRAWLDSVGAVCRDVAEQVGDAKLLELCAITHMRIELDNGDAAFETRRTAALQLTAKIADPAARRAAEEQVEQLAKLVRENPEHTDIEYD